LFEIARRGRHRLRQAICRACRGTRRLRKGLKKKGFRGWDPKRLSRKLMLQASSVNCRNHGLQRRRRSGHATVVAVRKPSLTLEPRSSLRLTCNRWPSCGRFGHCHVRTSPAMTRRGVQPRLRSRVPRRRTRDGADGARGPNKLWNRARGRRALARSSSGLSRWQTPTDTAAR
jgi:hypothetical protein